MLALFILAPLGVLVLLNLPLPRAARWAAPGAAMLLSLAQVALVVLHPPAFWSAGEELRGFAFKLHADALTLVLLLAIGIVLPAALLVGQCTIQTERERFHFVNLVLVAMIGMNGTVLLRDLFSLYVFVEITSVASFVLIASDRRLDALEGAFKYVMLSAVATVLMLGAVALLILLAGGTSFEAVRAALSRDGGNALAKLAVGGFVCGLFIKGGLVPFHGWLPAAYSAAPAPVSVLLAGIATKVSGVYTLLRLAATVFPRDSAALNHGLLLIGAASVVAGALAALVQSDIKRMLAYSSISQVGYIILGLGCGSPLGLAGAAFHLFNHSIFKSLLFVNSAALEQRLGTTDMDRMGGLGPRMPVTGLTSMIATLSTAGVPPLAGFWSKLIIILALWKAGFAAYACIAVLFSVVTLAYLLVIQRRIFFGEMAEEYAQVREASFGLVLPAIVLAAVTIGVGVLYPFVLERLILPVEGVF